MYVKKMLFLPPVFVCTRKQILQTTKKLIAKMYSYHRHHKSGLQVEKASFESVCPNQ